MNDQERLNILTKVFDNQQSLISSADNKANISLSVQIFLMTTVFGASIIVHAFSTLETLCCFVKITYYILFSSFMISSVIGLSECILVFRPRLPEETEEVSRQGISYFGHIRQLKSSQEYLEAIKVMDEAALVKEFACQNYNLALILHHKMRYVRGSTVFLLINILLTVSLLILSMAMR